MAELHRSSQHVGEQPQVTWSARAALIIHPVGCIKGRVQQHQMRGSCLYIFKKGGVARKKVDRQATSATDMHEWQSIREQLVR